MRQRLLLKMLANMMDASDEDLQSAAFRERTSPFFVEPEKRQKIWVWIGGSKFRMKKRSRRNGRFDGRLDLDGSFVRSVTAEGDFGRPFIPVRVSCGQTRSLSQEFNIPLLRQDGISVISDIDDTIKETEVGNRRELLWNTFLREFRSVAGMAEVYKDWHAAGAEFHYVSSSPWQLIGPLTRMQMECGFPRGTMHLRNFRLRDQFLKRVMFRRKGKASEIKKLIDDLPRRRFILVGDSGEKDPEIYLKLCRRYRDQVTGVFIRQLSDRPLDGERLHRLQRNTAGSFSLFDTALDLQSKAAEMIRLTARQSANGFAIPRS
jgi:phosphatidate phosphatase APP1